MLLTIDQFFYRPLIALWLRYSPRSWHRLPMPEDTPHVHGPGTNPDRILVAGNGQSAGRGVFTHELGIPGYLARSVSAITGRATDVDIVVSGDMTAERCSTAITDVDLSRFDAVLLSIGGVEALSFTSARRWARDLTTLLDRIEREAPPSTVTFVLSIAHFARHPDFPVLFAKACDRRADRLNDVARAIIEKRPWVRYVVVGQTGEDEKAGAHTYEIWADSVAPHVVKELADGTGRNPRDQRQNEPDRQAGLEGMHVLDLASDPVFEDLTARARQTFGTAFSLITLIDGQRQTVLSASGMPASDSARQESFDAVTIRREEHFVIEDTLRDSHYSSLRIVNAGPKVRFYAGYPIESPDGHRVGALSVLDTQPRTLSDEDAAQLRVLAQETQRRLWELSESVIAQADANSRAAGAPVESRTSPFPEPAKG